MDTSNITREEFEEIKRRFDEAESGEYTIRFGFPNSPEWREHIDPKEIFKET